MKLIFISGVSRAGKDTFAKILAQKLNNECVFESFAKPLREELDWILRANFNLDVYSQDTKEKSLFRDMMVAWAKIRRDTSKGEYFVNKLKQRLLNYNSKYIIVPDARFGEYFDPITNSGDELGFIKNTGLLVYLEKTVENIEYVMDYNGERKIIQKDYLGPANDTERRNDPIMRKYADVTISWPDIHTDNFDVLSKELSKYVELISDKL